MTDSDSASSDMTALSRRDFLVVSAGFMIAPRCAAAGSRAQVIVVGAGIAGLTAALELTRQGVDVILLEREAQPGGRFRSVLFDGVAANLGSQWVNAGISPLVDSFLERIPLQTIGGRDGGMALVWDGKMIEVGGENFLAGIPFSEKVKQDFVASVVRMKRDAAALYPGVDFAGAKSWDYVFDLPMGTPLWKKLEAMTIAEYLAGFDPVVTTIWGTRVSAGFGGTPDTISALFLVGWYRGAPFFPMTILKGGNHRLTDEMAAALEARGRNIRYRSEVTGITQNAASVTVTCRNGQIYTADYCIDTTPAPVAKQIIRGLSPAKEAALGALSYVPLTSLALHVRNFPDADRLSGALFVGGHTAAFVNQTGAVAGHPGEGTVILVVVTDPAKTGLPDKELLTLAGRDLKTVRPSFDMNRDLLGYEAKEWRVGEVHVSPGFLSKYHRILAEPAGRIYFGGEYVSAFPTWGGAVRGAQKAVSDILRVSGAPAKGPGQSG